MTDQITQLERQLAEARAEVERLREVLMPFAEVADWAERNGHDLMQYDMLLRQSDGQFAGHLQVQSADFIAARAAIQGEPA